MEHLIPARLPPACEEDVEEDLGCGDRVARLLPHTHHVQRLRGPELRRGGSVLTEKAAVRSADDVGCSTASTAGRGRCSGDDTNTDADDCLTETE